MIKHILLSLSVLSLLQACGGDGNDDGGSKPAAFAGAASVAEPAQPGTGKFSAKLVASENSRYLLLGPGRESFGPLDKPEQLDNGAVVDLGSTSLSGSRETVDIAGDRHFALGRWIKGTVKTSSDSYALTGKNQESTHYLAYDRLGKMPVSGQFECTSGATTAATGLSDSAVKTGLAEGTAQVSFDNGGAAIRGTMKVSVGVDHAQVDLATTIGNATSMPITGRFLAQGQGAAITLADQGSAAPALIVGYKAQLPGGVLYTGVARFTCTGK